MLPVPRRDVERLRQIIAIQPRLLDLQAPPRAQRALLQRSVLDEALTWLDVHGDRPEVVAHWRAHEVVQTPGGGRPGRGRNGRRVQAAAARAGAGATTARRRTGSRRRGR